MSKELNIENAQIIFRNFSGVQTKFNREGNRNFCVIIDDPNVAQQLIEDGWNIKILAPRDPEESPKHYMQVSVAFNFKPPKMYLITSKAKTLLDEDSVGSLDYADLANIDLVIRPYDWEVNGKHGVKGYVKALYATIAEDAFASKYEEIGPRDDCPF